MHLPSVLTSRLRLLLPLLAPHPGVLARMLYAGRTRHRRRSRTNSRYPKGSVTGKGSARALGCDTLLPGLSSASQATTRKSFALLIPQAQSDTTGKFHCIISEISSHSASPWRHRSGPQAAWASPIFPPSSCSLLPVSFH